ncbi:histidine kinase [Caulobacter sp. SLTY]|uniref:sensor histidine kinase n=1 Tax=Caulobacter sp. SLTY TaxID=2683262 RepID=UPI0014120465|nr:sensor histidine kinase [Caulobacter sp. SLTY]NBB15174.1 histidine kinase [Caulobacter sp. SLTY]
MQITDRLFNRLVLSAVTVGFVAVLLAGFVLFATIQRNQEFNRWVDHTYQVQQALADFRIQLERSETARRGYILRRDQRYLAFLQSSMRELPEALAQVERLTIDNPAQQGRVAQIRTLYERQLAFVQESERLVSAGAIPQAVNRFRNDGSIENIIALRDILVEARAEEQKLLEVRTAQQTAGQQTLLWVMIVCGLLVLGVAGGSTFVIFQYTRDLTASRRSLTRLNANLEGLVEERTVDLRRANDEIQRFAYIVSHDLRSPLVNIMGFTAELEAANVPLGELVDRVEQANPDLLSDDARSAVRIELPEATGFIRASTQKMDRLINAILRLSREGRRVLTAEPLDMTALVEGIAASLKHRTDELGATITIQAMPDLVSDRVAVEQILSNLIENAVKYLKPGRVGRIFVRGRAEGTRVVYEVEDNGRGIDPKDHERVFDLFRRAGTQDQPGEGIGLAHVRALAYRLGGIISCDSALDQGATFRLSLPAVTTT